MWNKSKTSLCSLLVLFAQDSLPPVSPAEFALRRQALAREVQEGTFFLEGAREPELENRFLQDDDFFYLTGVEAQDAALLLEIAKGKIVEETLFLPAKDANWERWNGPRLAPGEQAEKATGFRKISPNERRDETLAKSFSGARKIWTPTEPGKKKKKGETQIARSPIARDLIEKRPVPVEGVRAALDALQVRKSPAEIARLERAVRITETSFEAALPHLRPGGWEYEMVGAIEGNFLCRGAEAFAFPSIVGSGPNSCRLHYQASRRQMQDGDLVVVDIGAKFEHYCADVTRTLPVSGKFSPRQAEIYSLVLEAQKRGIAAAKPGVKVSDVHQAAWSYLNEKKMSSHFWHGTSHFVGLKVHDTPTSYGEELEAGMVITVEPGLYLPDENIGVRIEDDILITEDGCRVLSNGAPKEIAEIEAWIQKHRP